MLIRMNDSEDLLRRAMSLPAEARAALAGSLLRSLESAVDADAEAAWSAEIQRRLTDLDPEALNGGGVETIEQSRDVEADRLWECRMA